MRFSKRAGDEGDSREERRRARERAREARRRREEIERRARELAAKGPAAAKADGEPPAAAEKAGEGIEKPKVGAAGEKAKAAAKAEASKDASAEKTEAPKKAAKDEKPAKADKGKRERAAGEAKPKRVRGARESKPKRERGERKSRRELVRRFSLPGGGKPLRKIGRGLGRGLRFIGFLVLWVAAQIERVIVALVRLVGPRLRRFVDWLGRVATPSRVAVVVAVAAGLAAIASQAIDYRAIAIGEAAYADVSSVTQAPLTGQEAPWGVHGPLVGLLALVACGGAFLCLQKGNRRAGQIALAAAGVGLLLILAIDLPRANDLGEAADEYAGTDGVLLKGFYIQLTSILLLAFCAALPWIWRLPSRKAT